MARKRKVAAPENHERWLISYADFITLLFAFFVVMFASSQTDRNKAQQVSTAVKNAFANGGAKTVVHGVPGGTLARKEISWKQGAITELMPSMQSLTLALSQEIKDGKIAIHLEPRGLVVSLWEAAFFPSGDDEIRPTSFEILAKVARTIQALPNPVRLEGHTDSLPIHNEHFRSNWELSAARSIAMLELFCDKYGLLRNRFAIAGYADTSPVDSNDTVEGRGHNRRVDVVILNQTEEVGTEPSVKER